MAVTPDLNQIATVMSQLQHNYSQLAQNWFNIFYNPTPADITITFFDELGTLKTYTVPNRAKDLKNILNGQGTPEGTVTANVGVIYQDLTNGDAYIKTTGTGNTGWQDIVTANEIANIIRKGPNTPEGSITGTTGDLYVNTLTGDLYVKTTPTGNTGWAIAISTDFATMTWTTTQISNHNTSATAHQSTLANIAGSASQAFKVATPTADNEATPRSYTGNLTDLDTTDKTNLVNAVNEVLEDVGNVSNVKTGTVVYFTTNTAPSGYLICNGSAISRTTYSGLYTLIGTVYGVGDGTTTFNLPNLTDNRFIEGHTTVGTAKDAGLPNITGTFSAINYGEGISGAFIDNGRTSTLNCSESFQGMHNIGFNAHNSSSIYKNDVTTVQPKSLTLLPCIKY